MNILNLIADIIRNLLSRLKDLLVYFLGFLGELVRKGYSKFLELSFSEKIIFLNAVPAFFAVILPVAEYYIFETYFYYNNPLAVYMIGIVIIMWISLLFAGLPKLLVRVILNLYYLIWIIYLPLAGQLLKADPYRLCIGYYFNIAVPVIYIAVSLYSYYINKE